MFITFKETSVMKRYILCLGILALLVAGLINANAQNIMPDSRFTSQNDTAVWLANGTTFCYYNGSTYAFIWQREERPIPEVDPKWSWYNYVYIMKGNDLKHFIADSSYKFVFGYKHEDDYGYGGAYRAKVTITGNSYAFVYRGFMFWSCVIEHPPYPGYYPGTYYRLWARFNYDSLNWTTWYEELDEEPAKYSLGAVQVDSLLHLIYYDGSEDNNGHIIGMGEDIYTFDPSTRRIVFLQHTNMSLPGTRYGGMFAYRDTCSNTNYIYNTYDVGIQHYITLKGPILGQHNLAQYPAGASALIQGSAQGGRSSESNFPQYGNRFNAFYLGNIKNADKSYALYNSEWVIPDDCHSLPVSARVSTISLPTTCVPQQVDGSFQLGLCYGMIPINSNPQMDSLDDGLTKQIQVFYPDQDGRIYGAYFNSDSWRPVPGSTVSSIDLADDEIYGQQIRSLWTLVGITDGAPPCSIDWERWEATHNVVTEPTQLIFSTESEQSGEITSSYEDSYSIGGKVQAGIEGIMDMDMSFTYANTFKQTVSSGYTVKSSLTMSIGLNDESQQLGYYVWNVPQILRTSYMVYPWYDYTSQHPVTNTLQYQFRTVGSEILLENIPIHNYPFEIDNPNETNLSEFTQAGRSKMYSSANSNGLMPLYTIYWGNPTSGGSFEFSQGNSTITSVELKNSYKWEEGMTVGIPAIFKVGINEGFDVSYTSEYKYDTKFGQKVEVSLENLIKQEDGVNFNHYSVSTYLFKPNAADWWYLDSMNGQEPWYIGYIISSLGIKLLQITPAPAGNLRSSDLLFSWKPEGGDLSDYELFISTDPTAGPGSTIYRLACKDKTMASPVDFNPEQGKTYYWSVRGIAPNGEIVWSNSRAFTVGEEQPSGTSSLLKASVYPNPGNIYDMTIAADPETWGTVRIRLIDINGKMVAAKETYSEDGSPVTVSFSGLDLPAGIYLAVISNEKEQVVKKVVVK
jgi:hypothetical protein